MRKPLGLLTALALASAFLLSGLSPAQAATPSPTDPFIAKVIQRANDYRAASDAGPVVWNQSIANGSQTWSQTLNGRLNSGTLDMGSKLHRTDAGLSILPSGADMYSEVIAINNTPEQVVDWWMNSPAHRAALLDKRATDIGIGYTKTTMAGWGGMSIAVANLAGYAASRAKQPAPKPVPAVSAGDVAAIDVDGGLYVYSSAKGGDLWQRKYISSGWGTAQQVDVADVNADGFQDVVAVWASGKLTVSYGQSNETLSPLVPIGAGWSSYDILATKWRTTDAFPGIIARQRTTGDLFYYPVTNGQNLGARTQIGRGFSAMRILAADVDGDGRNDLVVRPSSGQLLQYRGTGTGGFVSEPRKVVGVGWGGMNHLSGITNHLGYGAEGILARDGAGNLYHYPIAGGAVRAGVRIGSGGWNPLLLGS